MEPCGKRFLRRPAVAAGVSKTAPYRHFADKRDLLLTLAAHGFRLFADALETALGAAVQPLERKEPVDGIRALTRAYLAFARSRPALYRLMFSRLGYSLHSESCRMHSQRAIGTLL